MPLVEPIDLYDEDNIPILARRLFESYDYDALPFLIANCSTAIEFMHQLYPNWSQEEYDKAKKVLTLEVLVKFCHLAENFAVFYYFFKPLGRFQFMLCIMLLIMKKTKFAIFNRFLLTVQGDF